MQFFTFEFSVFEGTLEKFKVMAQTNQSRRNSVDQKIVVAFDEFLVKKYYR